MSEALKPLKPRVLEVEPNSPTSEKEWKHWRRTFENYLAAFETEEAEIDKLKILTNFLSYVLFEYIDDAETYDAAIATLDKLFVKTPNEVFARHVLATTRQKHGQSLDEYLQELRRLSKDCDFRAVSKTDHRDGFIRDSFINGILSHAIRQRLLEETELTIDSAFNTARTLDIAQRNSSSYMSPGGTDMPIATIQSKAASDKESGNAAAAVHRDDWECYFCGDKIQHARKNCRARSSICYKCGVAGHFAKVCKSVAEASTRKIASPKRRSSTSCAIQEAPRCLRYAITDTFLKEERMSTLMDPGSGLSYINPRAVEALKLPVLPYTDCVTMASKSLNEPISGQCIVELMLNGKVYRQVTLGVMKDLCCDIILGQDFQKRHKRVVFTYNGEEPELVISSQDGGTCAVIAANTKCPQLFQSVTPDFKPVCVPSRRYSAADTAFIESEIGKLSKEGIIRPSSSPWRAQPLVVTNQESGKKRLCIDYSQTVNRFTVLDAYPLPRIEDIVQKLAKYKVFSTFDLKSAYHQLKLRESDKAPTAFEAVGRLWEFTRLPFGVTNGVPAFQRTMDAIVDSDGLMDTFPYLDNVTVGGRSQSEHDKNVQRLLNALNSRNMTLNHNKTISSVAEIDILGYRVGRGVIKPDPERLKPLRELPPPTSKKALKRALGLFAYYAKWIPAFSDRIASLNNCNGFPIDTQCLKDFNALKKGVEDAALQAINDDEPFVVECDASEVAVSATLNQGGRPIAFMSRTLNNSEKHYPAVEKEATAIIEAVRKWQHFLAGRRFSLITDQEAVSFMFDMRKRTKIKNNKIQCWRLELAQFTYDIRYRPGKMNSAPDALTRAHCSSISTCSLEELHRELCHPGVIRLLHAVRSQNLPYSTSDVKRVCSTCQVCAEIKPRFYRRDQGVLIKSTKPFERLNMDFKGPLPSNTGNKYILVVVDEFSRFPFCFACPNMWSSTVIKCLDELFALCGTPNYVHSDRGSSFMSREIKDYLLRKGVASSHSTAYHPTGNAQVERYNGILWKAIRLYLRSHKLAVESWELALSHVLQATRSLLCTSTNSTPHELFFGFNRRLPSGKTLPTWLSQPGPVFLKRHVRPNKNDNLVEEVELLNANPLYASVRHVDGRERNVAITDIAPCPRPQVQEESSLDSELPDAAENSKLVTQSDGGQPQESGRSPAHSDETPDAPRRSSRTNRGVPPLRYGQPVPH